MRYLLLLFVMLAWVYSQYPAPISSIIYKQSNAQPDLCYSMCLTCQTSNLSYCNSCHQPFLKTIPPICNITEQYQMVGWELWENTVGSGTGGNPGLFIPSPYWATNTPNAKSGYCGQYLVYGPFGAGSILTYSRTAPAHDFMIIKFFFVRINWLTTDSVNFTYLQTSTNTTFQLPLQYVGNGTASVNPTQLTGACDISFNNQSAANDMISSVQIKFFDKNPNPSLFNATFSSSLVYSTNSAWALSTFLVISGSCDPSCYTCQYSHSPTSCLSCVGLLSQATNKSCSICGAGRYMITSSQCGLCPINCTFCDSTTGTLLCTACPQTMTLTASGTCQYSTTTNNYNVAAIEANSQNFSTSFWTISPTPNQNQTVANCGLYPFIGGYGITSPNSRISRIFSSLPSHVTISIRANYLKVDRISNNSNVLRIFLDGQLIDNQTVLLTGSSNQCGQPYVDTIATIETDFIAHTNTQNVNLTFTSDTSGWGIRDVMIIINNCGTNCALCTPAGCQACSGFLRLVGVTCVGCQQGFVSLNSSTCIACDSSCMSCQPISGNCTGCYNGFLLINGRCLVGGSGWGMSSYELSTYGTTGNNPFTYNSNTSGTLFNGSLNSLTSTTTTSIDTTGWQYNAVTGNASVLQCQYVNLGNPNYTGNYNNIVSYLVSQNKIRKTFTNLPPHSRVRVMYTLMKIDNWGSDPLDLYLNDLLVNQDIFQGAKAGGSNVCGNSNENEYIYNGDITINDANSTLTVDFEAENTPGVSRYFAIKNLMIMVYNCDNCDSQSFTYKLDYASNNSATAYAQFDQPIQAINYGLTFEQIFQLYLNGKRINYTARAVPHNNKLWLLDFQPGFDSVVDGNLSLLSIYPGAIATSANILDPSGKGLRVANAKTLDNNLASVSFKRFDTFEGNIPYNFRRGFNVLTKILFFASLFSFLFGWQTAFLGPIHNLQLLWLHIYVTSKYIPSNLKVALQGFRYIQDLNFWSNKIQDTIGFGVTGDHVLFNSPAEYMAYHYDVSFFRHVYSIGIFLGIFWIIFGILILLFRTIPMLRISMSWPVRYFRYLTNRVMWLADSAFFYTFITLSFAVFAQFQDSRILKRPYTNLQLGGTIIALVFMILWPLFQAFYIRYQYKDPNFDYYYGQIHYRFYKNKAYYFDFWRILFYQLFRYGQIFWVCILFALLFTNYYAQIILLILTFAIHIIFLFWGRLYNAPHCSIFFIKIIQLIGIIGLQVILIVCYGTYQTLSRRNYIQLGNAGIAFCVIVVVCSFIRMFILLYFRIRFMFYVPDLDMGIGLITNEYTMNDTRRNLPMNTQMYFY